MNDPLLASRGTPTCDTTTEPLWIVCPHCEDGVRWTSRYGGNDPDVWRVGPCETCDGTSRKVLSCDGCDNPEAVEWFQGDKFCAACAVIAKEDSLVSGEDA